MQASAVMSVLLVTMATLGRLGGDVSPACVTTTLIPQTWNPVTVAQAAASAASTTLKGTSVSTVKWAIMVMPPVVPVAVSVFCGEILRLANI